MRLIVIKSIFSSERVYFLDFDCSQQDNNPDKPRHQTNTQGSSVSGWIINDVTFFDSEDG